MPRDERLRCSSCGVPVAEIFNGKPLCRDCVAVEVARIRIELARTEQK
jgi:hypothetical protein